MKFMVIVLFVAVFALSAVNGLQWSNLNKTRAHSRAATCDAIGAVDSGIISLITPSKEDLKKATPDQRDRAAKFLVRAKKTFVPPAYCK